MCWSCWQDLGRALSLQAFSLASSWHPVKGTAYSDKLGWLCLCSLQSCAPKQASCRLQLAHLIWSLVCVLHPWQNFGLRRLVLWPFKGIPGSCRSGSRTRTLLRGVRLQSEIYPALAQDGRALPCPVYWSSLTPSLGGLEGLGALRCCHCLCHSLENATAPHQAVLASTNEWSWKLLVRDASTKLSLITLSMFWAWKERLSKSSFRGPDPLQLIGLLLGVCKTWLLDREWQQWLYSCWRTESLCRDWVWGWRSGKALLLLFGFSVLDIFWYKRSQACLGFWRRCWELLLAIGIGLIAEAKLLAACSSQDLKPARLERCHMYQFRIFPSPPAVLSEKLAFCAVILCCCPLPCIVPFWELLYSKTGYKASPVGISGSISWHS